MSDPNLPTPVEQVPQDPHASRWSLIRELFVFQAKLLVDGFKDFVLGPLSFVAAMIDLVRGTPAREGLFYSVLRSGAGFDRWVGLFDAIERPRPDAERSLPAAPEAPAPAGAPSLEQHLAQLERYLIQRHDGGGLTADAKRSVDRVLDIVVARAAGSSPGSTSPTGTAGGHAPRDLEG